MKVQVRDPAGNVLPAGEIGEVYIWGAGVFRGYWNNPEATAAVLDEQRWYKTGDFGRTDGEFLTLESRMRDLIIRGGENIYPIEIENRLVEHPEIADAAVIGVDHQTLGQEVKAFIVAAPGCSPSDRRHPPLRRRGAGGLQGAGVRGLSRVAALQRDRQAPQARTRGAGPRRVQLKSRRWRGPVVTRRVSRTPRSAVLSCLRAAHNLPRSLGKVGLRPRCAERAARGDTSGRRRTAASSWRA